MGENLREQVFKPYKAGINPVYPKYPWEEMEVGDTFFVETEYPSCFSVGCTEAGKKYGMKFRRETNLNGVRVRRIA